MISLHVESENGEDLRNQLMMLLGSQQEVRSIPEGINIAKGGEVLTDAPKEKLRGRPRKNPDPVPEQVPLPIVENAAARAMAESTPPPSPATMFSQPTAPAPITGTVTFDQMKDSLQKVATVREGDPDPMTGLNRATKILEAFGYRKVKEVKPEQFAAVIEACGKA